MSDGVYGGTIFAGNATSVQLTTAWGVNAGYEHFWSPQWRTSLYGGYAETNYNATANALLCTLLWCRHWTGHTLALASAGCDNNWNQWWIGSRTQWNITKDFYMGVDVAYTKFESANAAGWVNRRHKRYGSTRHQYRVVPGEHQHVPALHQQRGQLGTASASASIATSIPDRVNVDV